MYKPILVKYRVICEKLNSIGNRDDAELISYVKQDLLNFINEYDYIDSSIREKFSNLNSMQQIMIALSQFAVISLAFVSITQNVENLDTLRRLIDINIAFAIMFVFVLIKKIFFSVIQAETDQINKDRASSLFMFYTNMRNNFLKITDCIVPDYHHNYDTCVDSLALSASHSPLARKLLKIFKVFLFVKKLISQSNKALLKPKFDFLERFFSTRKSKSLI